LHLTLELIGRATKVGYIAQHGQHGILGTDAFAEGVREYFKQEIVAFVGINEVELARPGVMAAGHRRLREE
jgi:hypothetical protein